MYSVMIAIEYSYKLDRKKLWCELGRLLLRQSHFLVLGCIIIIIIIISYMLNRFIRRFKDIMWNLGTCM